MPTPKIEDFRLVRSFAGYDRSSTLEMVEADWHHWREVSGSRQYTWEQVERVFREFLLTAARLSDDASDEDKQKVEIMWGVAWVEHPMRQSYRVLLKGFD